MRLEPPQPLATGGSALPSAPNRLLALPRELRDIIYEGNYALTEDRGLLMIETHPKSFRGHRLYEHWVESNRLKYVCRQLYHETKGLGLKHNDVAVRSDRQVEDFVTFLATCSADQQKYIRQVTLCADVSSIVGRVSTWNKAVETLTPYGASHPGMKFHLYVSSLGEIDDAGHWLIMAANVLYARHMHENHAILSPLMRRLAVRFNADRKDPIPDHIRIFPGTGPGDLVQPVFSKRDVQTYGIAQTELFIKEIEKWQREGI
ncbi:uncharacterized protein J4E79_010793 [Alternaria viburni]|uniref:uncharacterized protein n=1 Tax=Alternaria viburni TaxID=566460 RepID=UPI0020C5ADB4|nr:uncharacterized protein J4E79_010793 [Alternaria viburni]KAI4645615.1 hypothetical protein J4E79_010793 [Alternaria viburni]